MFSFFSFFSRENAFDNGALVGPVCVYIYIYIYIYHNINTRENIPAITPFLPRVSLCLFRPSEWRSLCCRIRWKMQITFQSSSLLCSLWLFGTCAGYPLSLELSFYGGRWTARTLVLSVLLLNCVHTLRKRDHAVARHLISRKRLKHVARRPVCTLYPLDFISFDFILSHARINGETAAVNVEILELLAVSLNERFSSCLLSALILINFDLFGHFVLIRSRPQQHPRNIPHPFTGGIHPRRRCVRSNTRNSPVDSHSRV